MKEWILKSKIRVILSGILIVAVPLVSLSAFVYMSVTETLKSRIIKENIMLSNVFGNTLERRLTRDIETGTIFASRPLLVQSADKMSAAGIELHLKILINIKKDVERAFVTTPKGVLIADYPSDPSVRGVDFSNRDWYKGVSKNWKPYVSEFYMRKASPQRYLFSMAFPIKKTDGTVVGILVFQPNDDYIHQAFGEDIVNGHAYVVNSKGHLVYHQNHKIESIVNVSGVPSVKKVLAGEEGYEQIIEPSTNKPMLSFYHPIKEFGWGVIVEKYEDIEFLPIREITLWLSVVTCLMLLGGGYFAFKNSELLLASEKLTKRLKDEEGKQKDYAEFVSLLNKQRKSLDELCESALDMICKVTRSDSAIAYICDDKDIKVGATFMAVAPPEISNLALECIMKQKILRLRDASRFAHMNIVTGVATIIPREILAVPLLHQDRAVGVLELASVKGFDDAEIDILERSAPQLAISLNIMKMYVKQRKSAEELKQSNEELSAMNEELQTMNEEFASLNKELKNQQEELRSTGLRLLEVSQAKSDFLANMSHELRTPLNSILGFSEVLQDAMFGQMNEKQSEYVGNIHTSGKHLLELINDILDIARVESGKISIEYSEIAIRNVMDASLMMFKEKAMKHNIKLGSVIDPSADIVIAADERRLKQILYNLLSNAVKFTPDGGEVKVSAKNKDDFIEVSVEDTGIGIKKEDMDKLFKEFSQIESPYTKNFEGSGLGLALSKRLVELHGGDIRVECEEGNGCTFTFSIPIKKKETAVVKAEEKTRPIAKAVGNTVLVIDDDPAALSLIEKTVMKAGYAVMKAQSGREGIDMAVQNHPGLIVLDMLMPGMSGFETAELLRSNPVTSDIPIIVLTAMELSAEERAIITRKANRIIDKGTISSDAFASEIKRFFERDAV